MKKAAETRSTSLHLLPLRFDIPKRNRSDRIGAGTGSRNVHCRAFRFYISDRIGSSSMPRTRSTVTLRHFGIRSEQVWRNSGFRFVWFSLRKGRGKWRGQRIFCRVSEGLRSSNYEVGAKNENEGGVRRLCGPYNPQVANIWTEPVHWNGNIENGNTRICMIWNN